MKIGNLVRHKEANEVGMVMEINHTYDAVRVKWLRHNFLEAFYSTCSLEVIA